MYDKFKRQKPQSFNPKDKQHSPTSSRPVVSHSPKQNEQPQTQTQTLSPSNAKDQPAAAPDFIRQRVKMFDKQSPTSQSQPQSSNNSSPNANQQSQSRTNKEGSPNTATSGRRRSDDGNNHNKGPNNNNNHNNNNNNAENNNGEPDAVVTPELLVDALSGHEDGLLAIAERLMEHYDGGYDVMGEAIIDAFADVQKLFQHVVEAAHMEGAAFEASRRESERKNGPDDDDADDRDPLRGGGGADHDPSSSARRSTLPSTAPARHDEFIDEDVRDVLREAVRAGQARRDAGAHMECYEIYETACNNASSLLPVDSDHRGRLQLSVARAESMDPERACAILRYSMDDVLRSGRNAGAHRNPDPDQRGDCVLDRRGPLSGRGSGGEDDDNEGNGNDLSNDDGGGVARQSPREALNSLVEEMREVLDAPVYENTPVRDVADRFWRALGESQRISSKNEERLENSLGQLKGEFLLARAEWEEKLNEQSAQSETFRRKYYHLKDQYQHAQYMEAARHSANRITGHRGLGDAAGASPHDTSLDGSGSIFSCGSSPMSMGGSLRRGRSGNQDDVLNGHSHQHTTTSAPSVASFGSALGQHARSLVGSIGCYGMGDGGAAVAAASSTMTSSPGRRKNNNNNNSNTTAGSATPPSVTSTSKSTDSGRRRTPTGRSR